MSSRSSSLQLPANVSKQAACSRNRAWVNSQAIKKDTRVKNQRFFKWHRYAGKNGDYRAQKLNFNLKF